MSSDDGEVDAATRYHARMEARRRDAGLDAPGTDGRRSRTTLVLVAVPVCVVVVLIARLVGE